MVRLVAMASDVNMGMADRRYELKMDGAFVLKPADFCCG